MNNGDVLSEFALADSKGIQIGEVMGVARQCNVRERKVVDFVEGQLGSVGRWYVNIKGDGHGARNGAPDIVTADSNGRLVGIECKKPGEEPVYTQFLESLRIVLSGGRYVVAYEDFSIEGLDTFGFPKYSIGSAGRAKDDMETLAFVAKLPRRSNTVEVVIDD